MKSSPDSQNTAQPGEAAAVSANESASPPREAVENELADLEATRIPSDTDGHETDLLSSPPRTRIPLLLLLGAWLLTGAVPSVAQTLSSGSDYSCSVLSDGRVKCWGRGAFGKLGQGNTNNLGDGPGEMGANLAAIDLGTERTATQISAGSFHTCARLDDGTVKCWGGGDFGRLGQGNTDKRGDEANEMGDNLAAIDLGTGRTATQISAGSVHTCALLDDGTVKCWGSGFFGQLGQGNFKTLGDAPGEMGDNLAAIDLGSGRTATQISVGSIHTCALLDDGTVKCWGRGSSGQLGQGNANDLGDAPGEMGDLLPAIDLGNGRTATQISAGSAHTCARLDDGTVKCWGSGASGQLGQGNTDDRGNEPDEMGDNLAAIDLGNGRTATQISAGSDHTCARLDDGTVKCWGSGSLGRLGQGNTNDRGDGTGEMGDNLPAIDLGTGRTATQISAGSSHTCARLDDGTVKCWGSGSFGQLGQGNTNNLGDGPDEMGDDLAAVDLSDGPSITISTVAGDDTINATEDDSAVTISGTTSGAEDGQQVTVGLNGKTYNGTVSSDAWSVTIPAADAQALNASETVTADVSDAAGNDATQATRAITYDPTPPTITISAVATDDIINAAEDDSDVTISGTTSGAEDGRPVTVGLNSKTYNGTVSSNAWSVTVPAADAQALGASETVTADVSDAAGNAATQATRAISHDVTAPFGYAVAIDQDPINNANKGAVSFTFTGAEVGASYNYTFSDGSVPKSAGANVTGSGTITSATEQVTGIDLSGQSDGTTTLSVTLTDVAGNTGTAATDLTTRDTAAPADYTVAIDQDPINNTNKGAVSFIFGGAEVGATYNYTFSDGSTTKSAGANVTGSGTVTSATEQVTGIDLSGQSDGITMLSVTLTDTAGNTGTPATDLTTRDTTPPTVTIATIAGDDIINAAEDDSDVTISGTTSGAEDNQTVTVGLSSKTYNGTVSSNAWSVTVPAADAQALDPSETVTADVSDAAGNAAVQVTRSLVHDAAAPTGYTVAIDQDPINNANKGAVSFTFAGAEVGATYTYTFSDGSTPKSAGANVTGSGTITSATEQVTGIDLSGQADGTTTLSVTLTDVAGNPGTAATDTSTRDTVAPTGYTVTIDQDPINVANKGAVSFTFAGAEVGATYNYTFSDGSATKSAGANVTGSGTVTSATEQVTGIDLSGQTDGTTTLSVTLTDVAGNAGTPATDTSTRDTTPPSVPTIPDVTAASDSGVSETDNVTSVRRPEIVGSGEAGSIVTVTSSLDGVLGTANVSGSGAWTLTPPADLSEDTHGLTAFATDAAGNASNPSGEAEVVIDVTPPSSSGLAAVSVSEDAPETTLDLSASFSDNADQPSELSFSLFANTNPSLFASSGVAGGVLTLDYLADAYGSSTITIRATDRAGNAKHETMPVTVSPVNDGPVLTVPSAQTMDEDATLTFSSANGNAISVADIDAGAGDLAVTIGAGSTVHLGTTSSLSITGDGTSSVAFTGTLAAINTALDGLRYTPDANTSGTGSLSITVNDQGNTGGDPLTATETVSITVNAVNDASVAVDDVATAFSGESVIIRVLDNDFDEEGDSFFIISVSAPTSGALTDNGDGTITYTADASFEGIATFTYELIGGNTAQVTVTVNGPGSDGDGVTDLTEQGAPNGGDGNLDGIADSDQTNVASLPVATGANAGQYLTVVSDPGTNLTQVVSADIPDPTSAPPASSFPVGLVSFEVQGLTVGQSTVVTVVLPRGVEVVTWFMYGKTLDNATDHWYEFAWDGTTGAVIHPETTARPPSIDLHFTDGLRGDHDLTANGVIVDPGIPIFKANALPVANADAITLDEDTSTSLMPAGNDTDADGDALTLISITQPENGTASLAGAQVTYTPNPDFFGTDSFVYRVSDGVAASVEGSVTVTVNPIQDLPVAVADSATTAEDTPVTFPYLLNDFDADGDTIFLAAIDDPRHGEAVANTDGTMTYIPENDFSGIDTFTYSIGDGTAIVRGTITVTVTATNDAPQAVSDAASTDEDTAVTIAVLANDLDAEGDSLTVASISQPSNGTVTVGTDGTIQYTPEADFFGEDSFTYTPADDQAEGNETTVTVTVHPVNDAPAFTGNAITGPTDTFELATAPFEATYQEASDVDDETLVYTWQLATDANFAEVVQSAGVSGGTIEVEAASLIQALEARGLSVGNDLEVYQRMVAEDDEGARGFSPAQAVTFSRGTAVGIEDEGLPTEYYLAGNYPNPFNPSTTISFGLPEPSDVAIVLYDMTGRQARILVAEHLQAGHHHRAIDLSALPSGVYLYRMTAGSRAFTKTLHLVK